MNMIWFEWKKIFERRLNVAAMLLGYLLIGGCVFVYLSQASIYDEETHGYVSGIRAYQLGQEKAAGQTDVITEDYVTRVIAGIQGYGMDLESDDAYVEIIRPLGDLFYFVARNYTDLRADEMDRNALNAVDLANGAQFYKQRMKKITDYINTDFSYGNYRESEKTYWIQKAEETRTPFRWGNKGVMDSVLNTVASGFYLLFVVAICTSCVFSSEYESGAASLLLTTKYGKNWLIWAKIAAAVLFTVGYLGFGILAGVGVIGLFLGFSGADLPIQLWNSVIPYNLTLGQTCLANFAVILLIGITLALVLLCCSATLRSSLATLVIGIAVLIAPVFFPMSSVSGLWNHINFLFPVRGVGLKRMLGSFVSYPVGDFVIPYVWMMVVVYIVISVAALLTIRKGFVKAK